LRLRLNAYPDLTGEPIVMVATIDELFRVVRSNPFIDGLGYFVEVTTRRQIGEADVERLTARMQDDFCPHSQATLEGDNVLGLDFHEHILTQGDDAEHYMHSLEALLRSVERDHGVEHLCIELQFDFLRARKAATELDELLRP
jgi:glutaredoxin